MNGNGNAIIMGGIVLCVILALTTFGSILFSLDAKHAAEEARGFARQAELRAIQSEQRSAQNRFINCGQSKDLQDLKEAHGYARRKEPLCEDFDVK